MLKILIVDDHLIIREGLKRIFVDSLDADATGESCSVKEVLTTIRKNNYDVVLLNVWMPSGNGLDLDILNRLKKMRPYLPILILGMTLDDQFAVRSFRAGASGYLTEKSTSDELIKAIKKVSQGRKYINSSLAEKLAYDITVGSEKTLHEILSDREYEVLCMIALGKTIKKIAEELSLAISTISTYKYRIFEKMNMNNNAEITYYAIKQGLIN